MTELLALITPIAVIAAYLLQRADATAKAEVLADDVIRTAKETATHLATVDMRLTEAITKLEALERRLPAAEKANAPEP